MTLQLTKKHSFDLVFDSQKLFRLILEAMSNPAQTVNIEEYRDRLFGDFPLFLAVAMTLLDNETSFNAFSNLRLTEEIESLTLARKEELPFADFLFISDSSYLEEAIENAKCGTLSDPHRSAVLIVQNEGEPDEQLAFFGPGIDGETRLAATRTVSDAIIMRDAKSYEYPQGIDLIFIRATGELLAVPRLVKVVR